MTRSTFLRSSGLVHKAVTAGLLLLPGPAAAQTPDYLNPERPVAARVADLIARMTLEEKVAQMMDVAPAIERLGVPEYNWWNEALHGVARSGLATVFPQAIGMAATWNDSLMFRLATVVSDEARAKHHEYVRNGSRLRYQGLTIWSPNINLFRDPRWGRGQETYGEDPFLTGRLATQFIRGLQGDDAQYLKTVATVKHFAVHSGPETERHSFDAVVNQRDLRETYLPHFEVGIREAGAYSLMCAYNRVFGKAACGSELLLRDVLRTEWQFPGFIVSDCGAIDDIYQQHRITQTGTEAAALAVRTGTDLDCGRVYRNLVEAVRLGLISEAEIDGSLARLFTARFRLGMFDPPERVRYAQIPYSVLDQPAHRELARQVARESIVLLKNQGNVLPLRKDLGTIAVIGPNADQWMTLLGNYNGMPADPVTPLRGIREAVSSGTRVLYGRGAEFADSFPSFDVVPGAVLFTGSGQPGLRAEYFANQELAGQPRFTRVDSTLDANWGTRSPRADLHGDTFSVRWTGVLQPQRTGDYQLGLIGTMRYELFLEDSLLARSTYAYRNEFGDPRLRSSALRLEAGRSYRIRVHAHETYGDAQLQLAWTDARRDLTAEAVQLAAQADAVVLVLGLTPRLEGEEMNVRIDGFRGGDRTSIDLPPAQQRLLEQVTAVGRPTVLVLLNGSALAINWAQENVPAIVEAWYPGQAGGSALADVLFGDYNPGGRLPITFYRSTDDLPPFEDYAMRGRTYRFFGGEPLYAFGHGLSYTSFGYQNITVSSRTLAGNDAIRVSADVTNTGTRVGDEVVQFYVQHLDSRVDRPLKDLVGYQRITLQPGERRRVSFSLNARQLAYWDSTASGWVIENNRVRVMIGASSADIRLSDTITVGAPLRLPRLFQDGMVLQRERPVPVWGWSAPNDEVTVTLAGHSSRTAANASGEWSLQLPAVPAGGPYVLQVQATASSTLRSSVSPVERPPHSSLVTGHTHATVRNVLVGDVWVASGQSNMEWPLRDATNGAQAVSQANDAALREFAVPHGWSEKPEVDLAGGTWAATSADHAGDFSAVGYFFARELRARTDVPIGIIHTSWGGSNIETWISRTALGLNDQAWNTLLQRERTREAALRDTLRMRIGELPTWDAGLVDGRALWADPRLDASNWHSVPVPSFWEQAGFPGLDGIAWYRTTFTLGATETTRDIRLSLGMIDDNDITWVNGTEVGRTNGYSLRRSYTVPAAALRPGANVITIRVADGGGGGGPYGPADAFHVEVDGQRRSLAGQWKFRVGSVSFAADGQQVNKRPSVLYHQMLHPLLRFPIKGVIWYQGESNANNDAQAIAYRPLFAELIQSWRREWSSASLPSRAHTANTKAAAPVRDFPFLWVQLPNFGPVDSIPPAQAAWALLREAQHAALALPNTAQVVAIDHGDPGDIHPRQKEVIGTRLARAARKVAYGEKLIASGPTYRKHSIRANTVTIEFDNLGAGLVSHTGPTVQGFAIAGADRQWRWAEARIQDNRVIVSSAAVPAPVAVRYLWSNSPRQPGLFNREGLPAAPFRTDRWGTD